ncbi:MAG: hypothetical protein ABII82_15220 [Verrucomicrobiota bacterium]
MSDSDSHSFYERTSHLASGLRALYPGVAPQAVLDQLGAGQGADFGHLGRQEQARQLGDWFGAQGLCVPKSALGGEVGFVGSGAEHETYFDSVGRVAVKVTHDGRFGHCLREEGAVARPVDYLQRLAWHNELFGDDIVLHGLLLESAGIRLVTSQAWIVSHPAKLSPTQAEIDEFLAEFGYRRSQAYPDGFIYFNAEAGMVIGDAQPANLLLDREGVIRPIDLVIAEPAGGFLACLQSAAKQG